jgi:hypothetical protein
MAKKCKKNPQKYHKCSLELNVRLKMAQKGVLTIPLVIRSYSTRIGVKKLIGYITPICMAVRSSKLNVGHKYLLNDTLKKAHTSFIMTRKNE